MWRSVTPLLAKDFAVVCADLRIVPLQRSIASMTIWIVRPGGALHARCWRSGVLVVRLVPVTGGGGRLDYGANGARMFRDTI
jgi:hypothetical protein